VTGMALRTVILALAWFACVNAFFSLFAVVLVRLVRLRPDLHRPGILVAIRLLPASVSIVFVAAMFVPVHWVSEPRDAVETFGVAWFALAAIGAALLLRSVLRWIAIARASRLMTVGMHRRVNSADPYEVDGLPGVSLAGIVNPRILIGRGVRSQLSQAELDVAIAHEVAHREAFDNLARWAMLCAPDFLSGSAVAARLEHEWHVAAESRADARATAGDQASAVHLASALIKVARLSASSTHRAVPSWSTLNDSELLEWRVQRLLAGDHCENLSFPRLGSLGATLAVSVLIAALIFGEPIHRLTEALVAVLP